MAVSVTLQGIYWPISSGSDILRRSSWFVGLGYGTAILDPLPHLFRRIENPVSGVLFREATCHVELMEQRMQLFDVVGTV